MSVILKYDYIERAYPDMLSGIGALIEKVKISKRFKETNTIDAEIDILNKAKGLCELKIVELWNDQNTDDFKAICSTYYDIATIVDIDKSDEYVVFEYIKLIAFGYLGEGWHLVRQYLKNKQTEIDNLPISENWNSRLLITSFRALVGLIRKKDWKDIDISVKLIDHLRNEQSQFEQTFLSKVNEESRPYSASELVSLYHFAKSIEIIGQYLIEGKPLEPESLINYHLGYAKEYAVKSKNISLQLLFQFFESCSIAIACDDLGYELTACEIDKDYFEKANKRLDQHRRQQTLF